MLGRAVTDGEVEHARWTQRTPHYVLSTTLHTVSWQTARPVRDIGELRSLKDQPGGAIYAIVDDPAGPRAVLISATVEIREDTEAQLPRFRTIRQKYGMTGLGDREHLASLIADERVLLAITPDGPASTWTAWGFD
jgi:hypothetical protein